jgi:RNA polymerase sigma-70 factor (ECF subfamily)
VDAGSFLTATRPSLVRFFRRRCNSLAQAEDFAQEVIARSLGRAEWATLGQAKGYVFRTAANLWRDQARHRKVQGGAVLAWDEEKANHVFEEIPIERILFSQQKLRRVDAALQQLGERTRHIFLLSRLEDMKYAEIASAVGLSVSAIEKHMIKAIAHLQQEMTDRDST